MTKLCFTELHLPWRLNVPFARISMCRPSLYKLPYNQRVLNREAPHNQPLLKFMSLLNKLLLELLPSPLWPNLEALLKRRLVHPHTVRTLEMSR